MVKNAFGWWGFAPNPAGRAYNAPRPSSRTTWRAEGALVAVGQVLHRRRTLTPSIQHQQHGYSASTGGRRYSGDG